MELLFFQITVQYYVVYERYACCLFIDQTVVISAASVGSVLGILLMVIVALFILWICWKMRKQLKVIQVCSYTVFNSVYSSVVCACLYHS